MASAIGTLGVNLSSSDGSASPQHTPGDLVDGKGARYMYVSAASAIAQYDCVGITEGFAAAPITKAMADDGYLVGVAQYAIASGGYGWVLVHGVGNLNVKASCAADVALYTSATAGALDDTTTSQTKIDGIVITTTAGGSDQAEECIVTYPRSAGF